MSMKRKKVDHEQGLSVQLSIVGHFFPRRPPQTKLSRHISARTKRLRSSNKKFTAFRTFSNNKIVLKFHGSFLILNEKRMC